MSFNGLLLFLHYHLTLYIGKNFFVSMPLLGLLLFLRRRTIPLEWIWEVSMPFNGPPLFLPYLLSRNPYFSSLPSVFAIFSFSRNFLVRKVYIGIFSHLHNLNKAISHIFSPNTLFVPCSPSCFPALSFVIKVFKIA